MKTDFEVLCEAASVLDEVVRVCRRLGDLRRKHPHLAQEVTEKAHRLEESLDRLLDAINEPQRAA